MARTLTRWRSSMFAPVYVGIGGLVSLFTRDIRVEEYIEDGTYTMRAELPGVDPDKDVEVAVEDGMLRVRVERAEEKHERSHSEFRYGRFVRTVALPPDAVQDSVTATYTNGILEITVKLGEPKEAGRRIVIEMAKPRAIRAKAA